MKTVHVQVWSDFICPWCWIAKTRLDRAMAHLNGELKVVVYNRAYRIARGMAPLDFRSALAMKFGGEHGAQRMIDAVVQNAVGDSLHYNFEGMRFGDTTDAHALVKSLKSEELRNTLVEALTRAGIYDGRDLFDRKELLAVAREVLPKEELARISFEHAPDVDADQRHAEMYGNSIPLFVLDERFRMVGAQPLAVFVDALRRAASWSIEATYDPADRVCSSDRC